MSDKTKHQRVRYRAEKQFAKFAELNRVIEAGGPQGGEANKQLRRESNTWTRRQSSNVTGFHKPQPKVKA